MDIQRIRNLTTGKLHTKIDHIYEDIEYLTGIPGVMTHQIPNVCRAMQPWLGVKIEPSRFWDNKFDITHIGEYQILPMNEEEIAETLKRFGELPSPLFS